MTTEPAGSPHTGTWVLYLRTSTSKQALHGYSMEAQEEACRAFLNGGDWEVAHVYKEVESGRRNDRPELLKALADCQKNKRKLLVAKIDRMARDVGFVTQLMESGVKFVAADMPEANELTIHIIAAMAQHESRMISERTKAALAVVKAKGKTLGSKDIKTVAVKGRQARTDAAQEHAEGVYPVIQRVRSLGVTTLRGIAQELTERGIDTPALYAKKRKRKAVFMRVGMDDGEIQWGPQQVKNVLDRIESGE